MNKTFNLFSFALVLMLIVFSCNEDKSEKNEVDPALTVNSAKEWFINHYEKGSRPVVDSKLFRKANWEMAVEHKTMGTTVIVVPTYFVGSDDHPSSKQLWIYKNSKGEMTQRIVQYIWPSTDPEVFDYKKRGIDQSKKFTGIILVKDWDNNFYGGYEVVENKKIRFISELDNNDKLKRNARPAATCVASVCRWITAYTVGYPEATFSYYSCYSDSFQCTDLMAFEMDNGGGGFDPATLPYTLQSHLMYDWEKVGTDPCSFKRRMLQVQANSGVETVGLETTSGLFIMLPTYGNSATTSVTWNTFYRTDNTPIANVSYWQGAVWIDLYNALGTAVVESHQVVNHYHSHPNGTVLAPSPTDINFSTSTQNFTNFYIVHPSRFIKYNSTGTLSDVQNNCN